MNSQVGSNVKHTKIFCSAQNPLRHKKLYILKWFIFN